MPTADIAVPNRQRRGRRRLRTRIILSFALFGFALSTLIAATTVYMRKQFRAPEGTPAETLPFTEALRSYPR